MSVVEADFGAEDQAALFELPPLEGGGAITLAQVKKIALEHQDTANLLKSKHLGHGRKVSGTYSGTIEKHMLEKGIITWTVTVETLTVEI